MKEIDFKRFMFEGKIKQLDLAKYLGVSEGYISQVASGKKQLSDENFSKVLNNPFGWDVSMLTQAKTQSRDSKPELVAEQKPQLSNVEILLRDMLAEKEAKINVLQERINELIEENARLKTLNEGERKGGVA